MDKIEMIHWWFTFHSSTLVCSFSSSGFKHTSFSCVTWGTLCTAVTFMSSTSWGDICAWLQQLMSTSQSLSPAGHRRKRKKIKYSTRFRSEHFSGNCRRTKSSVAMVQLTKYYSFVKFQAVNQSNKFSTKWIMGRISLRLWLGLRLELGLRGGDVSGEGCSCLERVIVWGGVCPCFGVASNINLQYST